MKIALQLLAAALFSVVFFGVALFLPAGTLNYWQAWLFIAVFVVATIGPSGYLAVRSPDALRRRLRTGPLAEPRLGQRLIVAGIYLTVFAAVLVSALDHRFGWSSVPPAVVILGDVVVLAGLLVTQAVVIQNAYAAATVAVEADQPLVTTGLYAWVRHPMYSGGALMLLGMPPALDSFWGLAVVIPALGLLAARIVDEEKVLTEGLSGYREYTREVRYRLLPGVW